MKHPLSALASAVALIVVAPVSRASPWVFSSFPFEMVVDVPCIGDQIYFNGVLYSRDHYVLPPGDPLAGALHDNWVTWYIGEWTGIESGDAYEPAPGSWNHAVVLIPNGPINSVEDLIGLHQEMRLAFINTVTGQRVTARSNAQLVKNAAGEIKVEILRLDQCIAH